MLKPTQLIAVYGFILNPQQEVLLVKRAPYDTHPNLWELPGGGVAFGENPMDACVREVHEETGLSVSILYPLATTTHKSSKGDHIQVIRIAYLCKLNKNNEQITLSAEHSEYLWTSIHAIPDIPLSDLLQETINQLKRHKELLNS